MSGVIKQQTCSGHPLIEFSGTKRRVALVGPNGGLGVERLNNNNVEVINNVDDATVATLPCVYINKHIKKLSRMRDIKADGVGG